MSNTIDVDNVIVNEVLSVDGYVINPSYSSVGDFLAYNGSAYVPTEAITNIVADDTLIGGNITTTGTIGINLANNNSWTGQQTLAGVGTGLVVTHHASVDGYVIDISAGATINQVLQYNGSSFTAATLGSITGIFSNDQVIYGNVSNATVQSSPNLTFDGYNLGSTHYIGLGSSPTAVVGPGAGSSANVTLSRATDNSGIIQFTNAGTAGSTNSSVVTVSFANAYANIPKVLIAPTNNFSALLNSTTNNIYLNDSATSTSGFTLASTGIVPVSNLLFMSSYSPSAPSAQTWDLGTSQNWAASTIWYTGTPVVHSTSTANGFVVTGSNTLTWSHTLSTPGTVIVTFAMAGPAATTNSQAVTWNGISMTQAAEYPDPTNTINTWIFSLPTSITGTANVVITIGGVTNAATLISASAMSVSGIGAIVTGNGSNGNSNSISCSGGSGDFVISSMCASTGTATLTTSGATEVANGNAPIEYSYIYQVMG